MPTITSMAQLETELRNEMVKAMNETMVRSLADMREQTMDFYSIGRPTIYHRTGQLGNSPRVEGVSVGGNSASFKAYLQMGSYTVPNPAFTRRGYASYFSPLQVMNAAEYHQAHVKGRPRFWYRSQLNIERDLRNIMSAHFK